MTILLAAVASVVWTPHVEAGDAAYRTEVREWRARREERLRADGGWLTVVGLVWLKEGVNRFGTDPGNEIVLPAGTAPPVAGVIERSDERITIRFEPGVAAEIGGQPVSGLRELRVDASGTADVVRMGRLSLLVIERGDRLGVRLKDEESPQRKAFKGLDWFDVDERHRIEGRFVPYEPVRPIRVPNVLGQTLGQSSPGAVEFEIGGTTVRLDAILEEEGAQELFFIFRDGTSGRETYGAGRFLYAEMPKDGKVVLDFNQAYNPPCAFTPFATCPLPPRQNVLNVRIEAGEKTYGPAH